jgi:sugar phosphate isomerase/epimerase
MYTRREFGRLALAAAALPRGLAWAAKVDSTVKGVSIGVQSYSFRDLPRPDGADLIDPVIQAMTAAGLGDCELWAPHLEPKGLDRESLRAWRLRTPLEHFSDVRKKFAAAGLTLFGFNYSFRTDFTDEEIDRGFEIARALGAQVITASTTVSVAKRVVPFAEKHKMVVAMHNHSNVKDPDEFATPESFAAALAMSKLFKINLDIGHFTAANFDAVAYLREHHANITNLHVKDRKKNQGENTPFGQGDTPIREVLQLLKANKWPIRAHLEYEYKGTGTIVEEVRKCYDYARQALA